MARELSSRLGFEVATGVRTRRPRASGATSTWSQRPRGGSSTSSSSRARPSTSRDEEVGAFLSRLRALRPDVALFAVDTALRLTDKVLPMFEAALERAGAVPHPPRRLIRETWALTPHLYLVSAKESLLDNLCRAVAEGLRALAPPAP